MTDLIEQGNLPAIKEAMENSLAPGSQSFEQSLYTLLQKDMVTRDDALAAADSKNNLMFLINNAGRSQAAPPPPPKKEPEPASFSEFTLNI
jgi:twitching motility protein PilU